MRVLWTARRSNQSILKKISPEYSLEGLMWKPLVASLVVQTVRNLPAMQETQVQSLGGEHPVEKGMVTHSSILAWRTTWTDELGGLYSPWGCKELDMTE